MPGGGPYPPYWGRAGALDPNTNARASSTMGLLGFNNKPKVLGLLERLTCCDNCGYSEVVKEFEVVGGHPCKHVVHILH